MATVRIQQAWRRAQAKKAKRDTEQAQSILRWATFMLKIVGADSAMTAYWMDIAHQQLKEWVPVYKQNRAALHVPADIAPAVIASSPAVLPHSRCAQS